MTDYWEMRTRKGDVKMILHYMPTREDFVHFEIEYGMPATAQKKYTTDINEVAPSGLPWYRPSGDWVWSKEKGGRVVFPPFDQPKWRAGTFLAWLEKNHPEVTLIQWQESVAEIFSAHHYFASGKTFLINFLKEWDR